MDRKALIENGRKLWLDIEELKDIRHITDNYNKHKEIDSIIKRKKFQYKLCIAQMKEDKYVR